LTANGQEVRSAEELDAAIASARAAGRSFIGLFVQSQSGGGGFVPLPLEASPKSEPKK
jgi:hypothetical protein